ncbi:MAG: hypothetical protein KAQ65_03310 [Candidatus Thorarchaeota archaeon]|nr:hypothetical protein [Candidatus Thorarchaeota archaeon]MCK5240423.1 hypothetical protein [Candidatus Thorarchaeota archaeon]
MPSQYRIKTLHPEGKEGVNIEREKYDLIRCTILSVLDGRYQISFNDLREEIKQKIGQDFRGLITIVKLDLEARGEIERIPGSSPQMLRMKSEGLSSSRFEHYFHP